MRPCAFLFAVLLLVSAALESVAEGPAALKTRHRRGDLEKKLAETFVHVKVDKTPLREVVAQLAKETGVDLRLDLLALTGEGVSRDALITCHIERDRLSLRDVLDSLLDPLDLFYDIETEVVWIRSACTLRCGDADADELVTRRYDLEGFLKKTGDSVKRDARILTELMDRIYEVLPQGPGTFELDFDKHARIIARISQTRAVHTKIAKLLDQMRRRAARR